MKLMVLDNYDSFTYNLVHYLKELSQLPVDVFRNDAVKPEKIAEYDKILISPGPGLPKNSGITMSLIKEFAAAKSILGICLGCQAIAEVFGGSLINPDNVFHGVASYMNITDRDEPLFQDIPEHFTAGRYHSWFINPDDLPPSLKVTVTDDQGMIMGITHNEYDLRGLQFHPESVLTRYGKQMLVNWLNM